MVGFDELNNLHGAVIPYGEAWERNIERFMAENPDTEPEEDLDLHRLHPDVTTGICNDFEATNPVIVQCFPVIHRTSLEYGVTGLLLTSSGDVGRSSYKRIGLFKKGKIGEFQKLFKKDITLL